MEAKWSKPAVFKVPKAVFFAFGRNDFQRTYV